MDAYEPKQSQLFRRWSKWSEAERTRRYQQALQRRNWVEGVMNRPPGESERAALKRLGPGLDRTTYRRWRRRNQDQGLDGLFDRREGGRSPMPPEVQAAICTMRRIDAQVGVAQIQQPVSQHHRYRVSPTKGLRVLKQQGLARPAAGPDRRPRSDRRLEYGGMKLVEAALYQSGYLEALGTATWEQVQAIALGENPPEVDRSGRDEYGRFVSSYNERNRKQPGDPIGPAFASVETKRVGRDGERLHVRHSRPEIIQRKLLAVMMRPLWGEGRGDGLRVAAAHGLEELCGYGYMGATLDLFVRELKYIGVAATLWEVHARCFLEPSQKGGPERYATVAYVDGTNKGVWSRLYCQCAKVSGTGRVMPAVEEVAIHSGAGVALLHTSYRGHAPLVSTVPPQLQRLERVLEAEVGRIVVIDAEGHSIPFLKGLEQANPSRGYITRLKGSLMAGQRIFNRTNYRAYRDRDRIRDGECDFPDPQGGTSRMRVVEVERGPGGPVTYLGASLKLSPRQWNAVQLGDLYFGRWPKQEANFRAVARAVGSKDMHGYGKQLVTNVSVVTELDEVARQVQQEVDRQQRDRAERDQLRLDNRHTEQHIRRNCRRLQTIERQLAQRVQPGRRLTDKLVRLAQEHRQLTEQLKHSQGQLERTRHKEAALTARLEQTQHKLATYQQRQQKLDARREIFAHDVELDSLISLLRIGLVLMITYVLKEYLGGARMEVATFLERVATLPARVHLTPHLEIVTLQDNRRDPATMALLRRHCEAINERGLRLRSGRRLCLRVEEPSRLPQRPPPSAARVNSSA